MHGDDRYPKFFVYLNLFAFSMLVLVLADNFLLTFLGWEGVGACSYFLISFWFERDTAASAGKKAFVTNRVGDFGFMIAMFLIFAHFGSLDYGTVFGHVGSVSSGTATAIGLLLFLGAVGQVGPAAAVHLAARRHGGPDAGVGPHPRRHHGHRRRLPDGAGQPDPRPRPRGGPSSPWSAPPPPSSPPPSPAPRTTSRRCWPTPRSPSSATCSSPSGSAAYVAAIFHMVTHAFFKALLFLGAGSVIHGLHDEQDMKRMGGLRPVHAGHRRRRSSSGGWPSPACPPFAGFWSKDDILAQRLGQEPDALGGRAVTALLTAYYMSRQVFSSSSARSGGGHEPNGADEHASEPHESPWTMTLPLVVLAGSRPWAACSTCRCRRTEFLGRWLEPVFGTTCTMHGDDGHEVALFFVTARWSSAGIGIAWRLYPPPHRPELGPRAHSSRTAGTSTTFYAFVGRPGQAWRRGRLRLRPQGHRRRRQRRRRHWCAPAASACARSRPASSATTPSGWRPGQSCCSRSW